MPDVSRETPAIRPAARAGAVSHRSRFFRGLSDGSHKAECTCGWFAFGTLAEVQTKAATHDLDWTEVLAPQPAAVQP